VPVGDAIPGQVRSYVLDGGDGDLAWLVSLSEATAESVRRPLRRAGIRPGGR